MEFCIQLKEIPPYPPHFLKFSVVQNFNLFQCLHISKLDFHVKQRFGVLGLSIIYSITVALYILVKM